MAPPSSLAFVTDCRILCQSDQSRSYHKHFIMPTFLFQQDCQTSTQSDETRSLVDWVWELLGGKLHGAVDLKLGEDFHKHEMERLLVLGLWYAQHDSELRPSTIQVLNFEAPLLSTLSISGRAHLSPTIDLSTPSSLNSSQSLSQLPAAAFPSHRGPKPALPNIESKRTMLHANGRN
ncbi:hypothetical protein RHMOL_Rhmol11G0217400 [Rhododendron molle]|uniref:Uncharacterized protein n=1 Tax=Rhododendron molle TaxID=49168 RepID=A0ACC0LUY6_RHOML|nr:hypothetical protein RHMOL_Rhmol11G0217400 [Rhododendron molle]